MALNPKQEKFVELYLADESNAGAAYIKAGYKATVASASVLAGRALERPEVKAAIEARRQKLRDAAHLSRLEVVGFLCDVIKTPVGKLDENNELVQEHSVDEVGEMTIRTKLKMPNKLEAVKILNQMMGWNAPEQVNHNHEITVVIGGDA